MSEYWREQRNEVFEALDLIEEVLDDYDENVGLAFELVTTMAQGQKI